MPALARAAVAGALLIASLSTSLPAAQPSQDSLRADYEFQETLASSAGDAPSLRDIGEGNTYQEEVVGGESRIVLAFPEGNGLLLTPTTGVIANDTYTIDLIFRFESVTGYRRIIDFRAATSDIGLYNLNGLLNFYPGIDGRERPFVENRWVRVTLTRERSGRVAGYVDGVQQFAFQDTDERSLISDANTLRFFRDDDQVSQEQSGGAVARIRLYDRALSPREVADLSSLR